MKALIRKVIVKYFQRIRIFVFKVLSDKVVLEGEVTSFQPVLIKGSGRIEFGENVKIGYFPSPFFYSTYAHLEVRNEDASILIGNDVIINNNFCVIAEKGLITIGSKSLIGCNVEIFNSDFHELDPEMRNSGMHRTKDVIIGNNVFIGNGVKILKGVEIGDNCVIASGAIVTKSFENNCVIGGNPAIFLKKI